MLGASCDAKHLHGCARRACLTFFDTFPFAKVRLQQCNILMTSGWQPSAKYNLGTAKTASSKTLIEADAGSLKERSLGWRAQGLISVKDRRDSGDNCHFTF